MGPIKCGAIPHRRSMKKWYVLYCSLDNVPKEHIKAGLVAWGGESAGSDSEVEDTDIVSADG